MRKVATIFNIAIMVFLLNSGNTVFSATLGTWTGTITESEGVKCVDFASFVLPTDSYVDFTFHFTPTVYDNYGPSVRYGVSGSCNSSDNLGGVGRLASGQEHDINTPHPYTVIGKPLVGGKTFSFRKCSYKVGSPPDLETGDWYLAISYTPISPLTEAENNNVLSTATPVKKNGTAQGTMGFLTYSECPNRSLSRDTKDFYKFDVYGQTIQIKPNIPSGLIGDNNNSGLSLYLTDNNGNPHKTNYEIDNTDTTEITFGENLISPVYLELKQSVYRYEVGIYDVAIISESHPINARVLLAGKTVWGGNSENGGILESITYNNEMTSANWKNVEGGQGQSGNDLVYGVNENVFYANDEQVADYDTTDKVIISQNNSDYLLLENDGDNFRFYFDETKARAYFLSKRNTPSIMTFMPSILSAVSTNQKRTIQDN